MGWTNSCLIIYYCFNSQLIQNFLKRWFPESEHHLNFQIHCPCWTCKLCSSSLCTLLLNTLNVFLANISYICIFTNVITINIAFNKTKIFSDNQYLRKWDAMLSFILKWNVWSSGSLWDVNFPVPLRFASDGFYLRANQQFRHVEIRVGVFPVYGAFW